MSSIYSESRETGVDSFILYTFQTPSKITSVKVTESNIIYIYGHFNNELDRFDEGVFGKIKCDNLFGGRIAIVGATTNQKITDLFKAIVKFEPKFESLVDIIRKKVTIIDSNNSDQKNVEWKKIASSSFLSTPSSSFLSSPSARESQEKSARELQERFDFALNHKTSSAGLGELTEAYDSGLRSPEVTFEFPSESTIYDVLINDNDIKKMNIEFAKVVSTTLSKKKIKSFYCLKKIYDKFSVKFLDTIHIEAVLKECAKK